MSSIVVIDTRVEDWSQLARAWGSAAEVVLLDTNDEPLAALASLVEARPGTATLHLVAHGAPGRVELAGTVIDAAALQAHAATLARLGAALGDDGELQLYGCQVAAGRAGEAFLDRLADLCGVGVSAATATLGHALSGGRWTLDATRGHAGAAPLPQVEGWMHTLPLFEGGTGDDTLSGGELDDTLIGAAGGDTLSGGAGNDLLFGLFNNSGEGGDGIDGADSLDGGEGDDTLRGNAGNDTLLGGDGNDNLRGDAGDDIIDGGAGEDFASYRFDELGLTSGVLFDASTTGVAGSITLSDGRGGTDTLIDVERIGATGTAFDDTLIGGIGNDQLVGNGGNDSLVGGAGDDLIITGAGDDTIDGGDGVDTLQFDFAAQGAVSAVVLSLSGVDLSAPGTTLNIGGPFGTVTMTGMEKLELGLTAFDDSVVGSLGADYMEGAGGYDTLEGDAGNDTLLGGDGVDELFGGDGDDSLAGGAASDNDGNALQGGAGNDTLDGTGGTSYALYGDASSGVSANLATGTASDGDGGTDTLIAISGVAGSDFNDTLIGSDGNDSFAGRGGNDSIDGGLGTDTVYYDEDSPTSGVNLSLATGTATGTQFGTDTLAGIENVVGSFLNDTIVGDGSDNRFEGLDGADSMEGAGGSDTLIGGTGDDSLSGGAGNDSLVGGDGFDIAFYSSAATPVTVNLATGQASGADGDDTLVGIEGAVGGSGNDTLLGSVLNEFFLGNAGNDSINGSGGFDRASYQTAGAAVVVNLASGTATGGGGTDTLVGIENLRGSNFGDSLTGDAGNNDIQARGGDDTVNGGDGDDFLQGEDGNDSLVGGNGEDLLAGGAGNDTLDGGAQPVVTGRTFFDSADYSSATVSITVNLGAGNGTATGQGNDVLIGIEGARGGSANDSLVGDSLDNLFRGNGGDDTMIGGDGFDIVDYRGATGSVTVDLAAGTSSGAAGNDSFSGMEMAIGGSFGDTLSGTAANDILRGEGGNDSLIGGDGIDRADYRVATGAVAVNLSTGLSAGADGVDTLVGIENVRGSDLYNDTLTGDDAANLLEGRGGGDVLAGGAGNDTLDGGEITDLINYNDRNIADYSGGDAVNVNLETGIASDGQSGTDTLLNINFVTGSDANDTLIGSTDLLFEQFTGGNGDDTIDGGVVTDTLNQINVNRADYSNTDQSVTVDLALGTASGATIGTDTLLNIQHVSGSRTDDTLRGSDSTTFTEQFRGYAGDDLIDGRGGTDIARYDISGIGAVNVNLATGIALDGQGGTDTLVNIEGVRGSAGNDTLTGGLVANDALEIFVGMAGADTINGGSGYDRADYNTSTSGVIVTLGGAGAGSAQDGYGSTDTLLNIEGVRGSAFNDVLTGSAVATLETFEGREGNDTINGGGGLDRVHYQFSKAGVTVNLATGTASDGYGGTDTLLNIDDVQGSRDFADSLVGNSAGNRLDALGGNDTLNGGAGNDTLIGGTGNDTYVVDVTTDTISETSTLATEIDTVQSAATWTLGANLERLTLTGTAVIDGTGNTLANTITGNTAANSLNGMAGNDTISGGSGNDTLNGSTGNDSLVGGLGNDVYVVDVATDVVNETTTTSTEIDTVQSAATWTLGTNLENLTLTGALLINGTGNTLANTITGNTAANSLNGMAGNDTISGGSGNDTLNGSTGNDSLVGGLGNDVYVVDVATDVVNETTTTSTEIDTVQSAATWTLGANLENLTLTGSSAINGTGNADDNLITGNSAANVLNGGSAGADTLVGGLGNDSYVVNSTTDVLTETSTLAAEIDSVLSGVTWTLGANFENLTLTGSSAINGTGNTDDNVITGNGAANSLIGGLGNDTLSGGVGNDTLSGGVGNDSMVGGTGNDTYSVDSTSDRVVETSTLATEIDSVVSSVTWTLGNYVERLTLSGTATINGTGNTLANTITGNSAVNVLNGGSGNDTINGGAGNDTVAGGLGNDSLTGGAGVDTFLFNTTRSATTNVDRITDFTAVDDRFLLDDAVFVGIGGVGQLAAANFRLGSAAGDASDRIIYNSATGQLFFDADGTGAGAATLFATVAAGTTITAADIWIG
ncbi:MAG: DUF4347 domain-containing protein [Piscinibacter sp.]